MPFRIRRERAAGQTDLLESYNVDMYQYSPDFRRQLKARVMEFGVPIQIILESTFRLDEPTAQFDPLSLSPLSDRAWNICTTLYYKAGGKPWRLSTTRSGVCYVGIVYHKTDPTIGNRTACCAAQMFLDSGDGRYSRRIRSVVLPEDRAVPRHKECRPGAVDESVGHRKQEAQSLLS